MKKAAIPKNVDEYLASVPEPARATLAKIRKAIREAAPKETEELISYRMPMYKYKGMLLGFCAFANHCSLFPGPGVILEFKDDLEGYQTTRGTIRFAKNKPIPATLVKKMVKARVAANEQKSEKKKSRK